MNFNRRCSSALPVNRNLVRVATESSDIFLHPSQRFGLILNPSVHITERAVAGKFGMREEAEGVDAVVYRDNYYLGDLVDPVVEWPIDRVASDISYQKSSFVSSKT